MFNILKIFRRKPPKTTKEEVTFGFEGANTNIDQFAKSLESIFGIRMYPILSMRGTWYSSYDINKYLKRQREGNHDEVKKNSDEGKRGPYFQLRLNNCPPDEGGPEFLNAGDYILAIIASSHEFPDIEKQLGELRLKFKELQREHVDP